MSGAVLSKRALVDFLKVTLEEIERDASFEGRLSYTCMDDRCGRGEFLVDAFIRNGNDEGQGGSWIIKGDEDEQTEE